MPFTIPRLKGKPIEVRDLKDLRLAARNFGRPLSEFRKGSIIAVHDRMQTAYKYELAQLPGKRMSPNFTPIFSPRQMLELGVFEGKYLCDCIFEFPREWFLRARLSPLGPDPGINYFGVKSRLPLGEWQRKGWIHETDPRGWFQWFCRYWLGRRIPEEDDRQIKRWRSFGARHSAQILQNAPGELDKRKVQRQALLQWSWDPFI